MTIGTLNWETPRRLALGATQLVVIVAASAAGAGLVYVFDLFSLLAIFYVAAFIGIAMYPRQSALVLLVGMIALEPQAIDFTRSLDYSLYRLPPGVRLPITITPMEIMLLVMAVSVALRPRPKMAGNLPLLVWSVPVAIFAGFLYGNWKGGDPNLGYFEARGLIFAIVTFFIAYRLRDTSPRHVRTAVLIGAGVLAVLVIQRYIFDTRQGVASGGFPVDVAFAHEDVIFLAIGLVVGGLTLLQARRAPQRGALLVYELMLLSATVATERRSGTLVILVAALVVGWLMLPKRPIPMIAAAGLTAVLFGAYLGAYWNQTYGVAAQPARAIRSQFDPAPRDLSSDLYRDRETFNVVQTIRTNRTFGVGLGRPFIAFLPLPDLSDRWPLQYYTPHNNIMWLWLKFGVFGASMIIGVWVLATSRAIGSIKDAPRGSPLPVIPLAIVATLVIYFAFAEVDVIFTRTRVMVPLAIAIAAAFSLPQLRGATSGQPATPADDGEATPDA